MRLARTYRYEIVHRRDERRWRPWTTTATRLDGPRLPHMVGKWRTWTRWGGARKAQTETEWADSAIRHHDAPKRDPNRYVVGHDPW